MNDDKSYVIATDVGGTCTDTVVFAAGEPIHIGKALSTPPDFANGVIDSIRSAAQAMDIRLGDLLRRTSLFTHGSTVVDNALLTRDGASTGLITTEGFENTLLVTRGAYGRWAGLVEEGLKHPVKTDRAPPLVPADRIRGVPERVDYKGTVIRELDEDSAEAAVRHLVEVAGVEAIAICFLCSPYNPVHERRVREIAAAIVPQAYMTISSDIAPVPGEYERTSTTVINPYAGRIAHDYITELQALLAKEGYGGPLLVMQGYGGLLPAEEASNRAVGMIECGPAAGVIGARYLGGVMGDPDGIAADMGGTTFKVGVIQGGALEFGREPLVDRYHYVAPKIEVVSFGAGGGSIVSIEPRTNVPRVGPKSAGARPGPVCYGLGGAEPTLTDVMTLIGYMDPATFLGGTMRLDVDAARAAFEAKIARPIGMDLNEAAFGGSCPLLAGVFGQELNVKRIVVPYTASVNCAFGLVSADVVHEFAHTTTRPVPTPAEEINAIYAPMVERARAQLADEGFGDGDIVLEWSADLHYLLFRIVDEAVITLKHVSESAITNEGHDLMVSLYRADGSLLMGGVGFLHHLTSAAEACKATIRRFGEDINEGDVFLLNDPYTAALHTSDIFTEGFSSPGIRLVSGGRVNQDVMDTMLNMVRSPEMVALDMSSMIACNNVARERMLALIEKYGHETVDEACRTLIEQSETLPRERLRELPDGSWQSRQYIDVKGEAFKVNLTMTKRDDRLVFEFSGSSPQAPYAINCTK